MLPQSRRSVVNTAIIMSLWHQCCSQQMDPVPPNSIAINGALITVHGYAATGPKLERHTCRSMLHCGHLCLKNPKCISFNYQVSSVRNGLCELSEEGIVSSEELGKLNQMPGFVFVQTVRRDLVRLQFVWSLVSFCLEISQPRGCSESPFLNLHCFYFKKRRNYAHIKLTFLQWRATDACLLKE